MTQHKPTEEQQAVVDAVASGVSVMVDALAGCTKSTTLEMAAPRVRVPALALAFNKKTATELGPRLPSNFTTKTFNALGHGAIMRAWPGMPKPQLDDRKLGKLVTEVAKERKVELAGEQWDGLRQLVAKVMQAGITPSDRGRPLIPDTRENWAAVADGLWMDPDEFEFGYEIAREVLRRDVELVERQGIISFDDQIYISACIAGKFGQYPVLFVDEKQDLSALNLAIGGLSIAGDGQICAVGDERQSIYQFRGADKEASRKMRLLRKDWADRSLLTTFRCPKVVVERQQGHAPGYRAWHTNPQGRFAALRYGQGAEALEEGWNWDTVRQLLPHPNCSIGVICRNNGPLLSLAFKLIREQVGVSMLGRDIGKGLVVLSRKVLGEDNISAEVCIGKVREWMGNETALALANGNDGKVDGIRDRGECLIAVLESGCRDSGELRRMLEQLFSRVGQVQLGSGHRWKGLEADFILHLDPWRIPSRWAKEAAKAGDRTQMEQEFNLLYVTETRTKHTLVNANLEDYVP